MPGLRLMAFHGMLTGLPADVGSRGYISTICLRRPGAQTQDLISGMVTSKVQDPNTVKHTFFGHAHFPDTHSETLNMTMMDKVCKGCLVRRERER